MHNLLLKIISVSTYPSKLIHIQQQQQKFILFYFYILIFISVSVYFSIFYRHKFYI